MICDYCGADAPDASRFCPSCGSAVGAPPADETVRLSDDYTPSSRAPIDHGGFVPGAVVAQRYRIVAMLGRGGMGEVYRADDLVIGQQVALKFLPRSVERDPERLNRLISEVRIARQIAHPNVCGVYDIGSDDGRHFISMEYVKGEDLASLLHRIGRLAPDKATQIARQLCAGLAAAHERGVLHRDLKPANIMLDDRGVARITDFGLAAIAADIQASEVAEGTPAYMAPEQLAGSAVTVRSDIYSLGLVLYELYTGRSLFGGATIGELLQQRSSGTGNLRLSDDVDPAITRLLERCMAEEPERRPPSALAVAAALSGGDPLAAALAVGETPSPALVAAAGNRYALEPRVAIALLVAVLVGVLLMAVVRPRADTFIRAGLDESPDALAGRARDLIARLGYTAPPADEEWQLEFDEGYRQYVARRLAARTPTMLDPHLHSPIYLWYRSNPGLFEPRLLFRHSAYASFPGTITESDPQPVTGSIALRIDPSGRLLRLRATPPAEDAKLPPRPADWSALLAAAGLDAKALREVPPSRSVLPFDARRAWEWREAASGNVFRAEAAMLRGWPTSFDVIAPWSVERETMRGPALLALLIISMLFIILLTTVVLLARRNLRLGRGDRSGAARLAVIAGCAELVAWTFGAHHVPALFEVFPMLLTALVWASFGGLALWALYLALEPIARRRWPHTIVSWTRALSGNLRDPLVGRDVLLGIVGGLVVALFELGSDVVVAAAQHRQLPYFRSDGAWVLLGSRFAIAELISVVPRAITDAIVWLILLLLCRALLRRDLLAGIAFIVLQTVVRAEGGPSAAISGFVLAVIIVFLAFRLGLLPLVVMNVVTAVTELFPIGFHGPRWTVGLGIFGAVVIVGLAAAAVYASLGGKALIRGDLLET